MRVAFFLKCKTVLLAFFLYWIVWPAIFHKNCTTKIFHMEFKNFFFPLCFTCLCFALKQKKTTYISEEKNNRLNGIINFKLHIYMFQVKKYWLSHRSRGKNIISVYGYEASYFEKFSGRIFLPDFFKERYRFIWFLKIKQKIKHLHDNVFVPLFEMTGLDHVKGIILKGFDAKLFWKRFVCSQN